MLNVRLAGDHLCGKLLFTWLSLVVSVTESFCSGLFPIFPRGVLDEILDFIESVSEGISTYSYSRRLRINYGDPMNGEAL